jgi:putative ABC transport system ATP-binding protein
MIEVKELKKYFSSGDTPVKAVDEVSFSVAEGTFASIIGRSGSGKTTLLSLLGALDRPDSGSIEVAGQDVAKLPAGKQTRYRCRTIGFVFQSYNLVPNLSALQNVMLPMEFAGVKRKEREVRAEKLLGQVGITGEKLIRKPAKLSGGEQQRVAIARALANRPKLILADEPTGNLDSQTGKQVIALLRELARSEKTTIIAVTHDEAIARQVDETFRLSDGKLSKLR